MRAVTDRDGARRADLAAIHVAKKALAWDDETYRDIMFTVCRVRSSAEMDFTARKRFLAHLRACQSQLGARPGAPATGAAAPPALPGRSAWSPALRRLWSLWQQLADAGLVAQRDRRALDAWARRQTGVDRLEWLNPAQLELAIDSAKRWLARRTEA